MLKAFNSALYKKLTEGKPGYVLNSLKILKDEGVWLEISNLLVPSWPDDNKMIKEMCIWLYKNGFADTPLHFGKFYPDFKLKKLTPAPISTLETGRNIALREGLKFVYVSNAGGSDTTCPNCQKLLINR